MVPRQGYYGVLYDIRWDATNTVTVSGSLSLWAIHYNNNGEFPSLQRERQLVQLLPIDCERRLSSHR